MSCDQSISSYLLDFDQINIYEICNWKRENILLVWATKSYGALGQISSSAGQEFGPWARSSCITHINIFIVVFENVVFNVYTIVTNYMELLQLVSSFHLRIVTLRIVGRKVLLSDGEKEEKFS